MRKVEELQQQILTLSREEFAELRVWFWEHDSALSLTAEERAELDRCLDAYEKDPNGGRVMDAEWLKEAKDRLAAYRSGELAPEDAERVFDELDKQT